MEQSNGTLEISLDIGEDNTNSVRTQLQAWAEIINERNKHTITPSQHRERNKALKYFKRATNAKHRIKKEHYEGRGIYYAMRSRMFVVREVILPVATVGANIKTEG